MCVCECATGALPLRADNEKLRAETKQQSGQRETEQVTAGLDTLSRRVNGASIHFRSNPISRARVPKKRAEEKTKKNKKTKR